MRQDLIALYDTYTHGAMPRRTFLARLARLAGGAAVAAALLPLLENNYARAAIVAEDDPRLETGTAMFTTDICGTEAYTARPKSGGVPHCTVLVIHENRGLNPHIRDVTRRLALEGFHAVAPDILTPVGGTPADEDQARRMISLLDTGQVVARLKAMLNTLRNREGGNGKVGAVGFCWGGGMVNLLAARAPELVAGVAYYGRQVDAAEATNIKASLMLHYAGLDDRINAGVEAYRAALDAHHVDHQICFYDGVHHAFNNDTNAARYDAGAAELAWGRSVAFLMQKLA